jgi:membrane associated rhomboid family serine protease
MIPLRDATRSPVRFPLVTVGLIAVNVVAFIWEIGSDDAAILRLTVVPAQLMRGQGWITPFTAMFLHGGFIHIISNMLFLSVFAPAVEDRWAARDSWCSTCLVGSPRPRRRWSPASTVPQLGTSGAIA